MRIPNGAVVWAKDPEPPDTREEHEKDDFKEKGVKRIEEIKQGKDQYPDDGLGS